MITIALLPGDGVGPEVLAGPIELARRLAEQEVLELTGPWPVGATAYDALGTGLPSSTLEACERADAILMGAIGEHPGLYTAAYRPELALVALRERFDLRVSIREVWRGGEQPTIFVRNLLGGAYSPSPREESDGTSAARDVLELRPEQIRELAGIALVLARAHAIPLISVDKANLLATSRLWRRTVGEVAAAQHVEVRDVFVDRMAQELAKGALPAAVIITEGLFGDILSDLAAGRAGSIALCGSASIRPDATPALFEPVHGSAPLRAGRNLVNPIGGYLALAMLLAWFPETAEWAPRVRGAVSRALAEGPLTYDLARPGTNPATTTELASRINANFGEIPQLSGRRIP